MVQMDYEACYRALQLNFGAGLKEVNESWRKLSRKHHPDLHARDPKAHRQALEKQKQINNARDILKKWFDLNPNAVPPQSSSNPGEQLTPSQSMCAAAVEQLTNDRRMTPVNQTPPAKTEIEVGRKTIAATGSATQTRAPLSKSDRAQTTAPIRNHTANHQR